MAYCFFSIVIQVVFVLHVFTVYPVLQVYECGLVQDFEFEIHTALDKRMYPVRDCLEFICLTRTESL